MRNSECKVAAIVLAAGISQRMGIPKMTLPWMGSTVLGTVVSAVHEAGVGHIRVVTGGSRELVEQIIEELSFPVEVDFNPGYANGEMLDSIKVGLSNLGSNINTVLIALGDQPQIEVKVISAVVMRYCETHSTLIVPSHQIRRGHPWLIEKSLWGEILGMASGLTMRDFFAKHSAEIDYLSVNTPSGLQDLDTPGDYKKALEK